jgi:hypothetical protein
MGEYTSGYPAHLKECLNAPLIYFANSDYASGGAGIFGSGTFFCIYYN